MADQKSAKKELAKFIEQLSEEDAVRILAFAKSVPKKSDQKHSKKAPRSGWLHCAMLSAKIPKNGT